MYYETFCQVVEEGYHDKRKRKKKKIQL